MQPREQSELKLVDRYELAAVLAVNAETVKRLHREGRLPSYLVGKNRVRFNVQECLACLRIAPVQSSEGCHA